MPTVQQLVRKGRTKKKHTRKAKASALDGQPQMRGTVLHTGIKNPKKPNSAERKFCRVRLSNGKEVSAFIPGQDHNIQQHANVLIRGGRTPDLPGFRYRVVRGTLDTAGVSKSFKEGDTRRATSRSKYGTKRAKT